MDELENEIPPVEVSKLTNKRGKAHGVVSKTEEVRPNTRDLKGIFTARQLPRDTAGGIMHNFKNSSVKQQTSLGMEERFRREESDV